MKWVKTDIIQGTTEWRLARLGRFTSSRIGDLMKPGRKNTRFGSVASDYIDKIIGERMIDHNNILVPDEWDELFDELEPRPSKAMRRGLELEPLARAAWAGYIGDAYEVERGGFLQTEDGLCGDSPDAVAYAGGLPSLAAEIKCPGVGVHAKALYMVRDNDSLFDFNSVYYWQCMMHIWATGCHACDFVSYDPRCRVALHVVRIRRDEEAIDKMRLRVMEAEEEITRRLEAIDKAGRQ